MTPEIHELTNIQLACHSDMTDSEIDAAFRGMVLMNRHINRVEKQLRSGTLNRGDVEAMNDCLAEYGLDPFHYYDTVVENINGQIRKGICL